MPVNADNVAWCRMQRHFEYEYNIMQIMPIIMKYIIVWNKISDSES